MPGIFEKRLLRLGVERGKKGISDAVHELVARELGFDSWEHMKTLEENESASFESLERAVIAAALVGNSVTVRRLCDGHQRLLRDSPAVSLALAADDASSWKGKIDANERLGPMGWHPLTYLCCVRSSLSERSPDIRLATVKSMLENGADPSVGCFENDTIRGFLTVLGGAIGFSQEHRLVHQLLKAGADIDDGPTLYEGCAMWYAVQEDDVKSMQILLQAEPPHWHLCHALPHAIDLGSKKMISSLLRAGADPNWDKTALSFRGGSLHEAIVANGLPTVCKSLVDAGASITQHDTSGRSPLAVAVALNRTECVSLLSKLGASMDECSAVDHWVGACFAGNSRSARELAQSLPEPNKWRYEDHLWLRFATSRGSLEAMKLMLDGGMNPNAVDYDGYSALHAAAMLGDLKKCQLLVETGANPDLIDFQGRTPLDKALEDLNCSEELIEILNGECDQRSNLCLTLSDKDAFEEAASAIPVGDLKSLIRVCSDRPHFAHARSPRPHHCTLLNYVGVNGFEGERQVTPSNILDLMDYLIEELGCDARALTYTYRGGPGNDTVGLLTSSGHPREQGMTMAMTHKLAKAGAEVSDGWRFLVTMQDQRDSGTLDVFLGSADMCEKRAIEAFIESTNLGDTDFVQEMLEAGIDPNATLWGGVRAIHQAAINGNRQLVEVLLAHGADPQLKDSTFDGTAVGWAQAGGHEELAKWIWKRIRAEES